MRNRLIFVLFVALLSIPAMPAAADDASPTPAPSESATPVDGSEAPQESPSASSEPTEGETSTQPRPSEPNSQSPRPRTVPQQQPTAAVTITASSAGTTGVGRDSYAWGVATEAPSAPVWTEAQMPDGTWGVSQRGHTTTTGHYTLRLTYGMNSPGSQTFRVGVSTPGGHVYSEPITLTRIAISASSAGARQVGVTSYVWGTAAGAPNTEVWTEAQMPDGTWGRSQTGRTTETGYYSLPLTYGSNSPGRWVYRVAVRSNAGIVYSQPVTLTRISMTATTAGSRGVGIQTYVWGTAAGAPNSEVWTEARMPDGSWGRSQTSRTGATGSYSIPLTYGMNSPGTYTFRVGVRTNGVIVYSSWATLTRVANTNLDSRCLTGRVMCASKKDRKMWWVINGQIQKTFDARFGCPGTPSDNGSFRVFWKSYNHTSTIYGTWMPRAMFYNGGEAVHFSQDFQSRGWAGCSGGCINIRDWNGINDLYNEVRNGDKVVVY